MSKQTWVQWVVAAILVVIVGAFIASAEERIEVRVEKESADLISVDVNGVTEVVRLEDLADGESRTFDVGVIFADRAGRFRPSNNGRGLIDSDKYYQVPDKPGYFVCGDIVRPHLLTTAIGQAAVAVDSNDR